MKDSRTHKKQAVTENVSLVEIQTKEPGGIGYLGYLLARGYGKGTANNYIKNLERFKVWLSSENIPREAASYNDVLGYIKKLEHLKRNTVAKHVLAIKHYYQYLIQQELVAENPVDNITIKGIKRRVLYDVLSKQELESLYHHYEVTKKEGDCKNQNWHESSVLTGKRNKVILGLVVYQGLGSRDLGRLTENDIKLREGKIYIAGSRSSNERTLKLESHQVLDIMEYITEVRPKLLALSKKQGNEFLVNSQGGSKFTSVMGYLIKQLKTQHPKVTGIKQIRTSVITHWLKVHNLRQVQYMAGHRYVSSTESYLINDLDDLQEDINNYHPIG